MSAKGQTNQNQDMPMNLQIIRANEFIRFGPQGKLNLASSRQALAELAQACRRRRISRALIDAREARSDLTPNDIASLVRAFDAIGFTRDQRLAILHVASQTYRARVFTLFANLRGWKVRSFGDFEQALEWLALTGESDTKSRTVYGVEHVPIRHGKTTPAPTQARAVPINSRALSTAARSNLATNTRTHTTRIKQKEHAKHEG